MIYIQSRSKPRCQWRRLFLNQIPSSLERCRSQLQIDPHLSGKHAFKNYYQDISTRNHKLKHTNLHLLQTFQRGPGNSRLYESVIDKHACSRIPRIPPSYDRHGQNAEGKCCSEESPKQHKPTARPHRRTPRRNASGFYRRQPQTKAL